MERAESKRARRPANTMRRGAAVVEMAVVTPLFLTLLFGIIEFSWYMSSQQTLTNAAREGCRVAVIKGSLDSEVTTRITNYLTPAGLAGATINLTRASLADPTETITLTLPYSQISLLGEMGCFIPSLNSKVLTATCSMRKEGT